MVEFIVDILFVILVICYSLGVVLFVVFILFIVLAIIMLILSNLVTYSTKLEKKANKEIKWKHVNKYTSIEEINKLPSKQKEKAFVISRIEKIYITNATKRELDMKKTGFFHRLRKMVRGRLVYHTKSSCEYALKDYVVNEELVALNSGVIASEYQHELVLCKVCAKEVAKSLSNKIEKIIVPTQNNNHSNSSNYRTTCTKCGGSGYLSHYNHVQGGVCFRCNGLGKC